VLSLLEQSKCSDVVVFNKWWCLFCHLLSFKNLTIVLSFCHAGDWTQSLKHARQVLYIWAIPPAWKICSGFELWVSHLLGKCYFLSHALILKIWNSDLVFFCLLSTKCSPNDIVDKKHTNLVFQLGSTFYFFVTLDKLLTLLDCYFHL
jgi:hypothetical protein